MRSKKNLKKKITQHLKGDMKMFKHEAEEDQELINTIKKDKKMKKSKPKKGVGLLVLIGKKKKHEAGESPAQERAEHKKSMPKKRMKKNKVAKVMREFVSGELHSGSKKGPRVTNPKQALAIGYSEARKKRK